jgi:hypothetical protein
MVRFTWEEVALIILFSAVIGGSITKGNWWTVATAATFVGFIVTAGARAPSPQPAAHPTAKE